MKYQASIETPPGDVNDRILFQDLGGSPAAPSFP